MKTRPSLARIAAVAPGEDDSRRQRPSPRRRRRRRRGGLANYDHPPARENEKETRASRSRAAPRPRRGRGGRPRLVVPGSSVGPGLAVVPAAAREERAVRRDERGVASSARGALDANTRERAAVERARELDRAALVAEARAPVPAVAPRPRPPAPVHEDSVVPSHRRVNHRGRVAEPSDKATMKRSQRTFFRGDALLGGLAFGRTFGGSFGTFGTFGNLRSSVAVQVAERGAVPDALRVAEHEPRGAAFVEEDGVLPPRGDARYGALRVAEAAQRRRHPHADVLALPELPRGVRAPPVRGPAGVDDDGVVHPRGDANDERFADGQTVERAVDHLRPIRHHRRERREGESTHVASELAVRAFPPREDAPEIVRGDDVREADGDGADARPGRQALPAKPALLETVPRGDRSGRGAADCTGWCEACKGAALRVYLVLLRIEVSSVLVRAADTEHPATIVDAPHPEAPVPDGERVHARAHVRGDGDAAVRVVDAPVHRAPRRGAAGRARRVRARARPRARAGSRARAPRSRPPRGPGGRAPPPPRRGPWG